MAVSVPEYPAKERLPPPKCLTPAGGLLGGLAASQHGEAARLCHCTPRSCTGYTCSVISYHINFECFESSQAGAWCVSTKTKFNTSKCVPFFADKPFQKCSGLKIMKLVSYQLSDLRRWDQTAFTWRNWNSELWCTGVWVVLLLFFFLSWHYWCYGSALRRWSDCIWHPRPLGCVPPWLICRLPKASVQFHKVFI